MLFDFHTHTLHSDGVLIPIELLRRAKAVGYTGIALTDHVGRGPLARIITEQRADCALAETYWGIRALVGVELTHVPAAAIADLAAEARELGADIVVVHGETPVEPVEPGTNHAAVSCPLVDILAHPGFLTLEDAMLAQTNEVFLEISTRRGHNACNGQIVTVGRRVGARFLVNSDTHEIRDLLSPDWARTVALGAGLGEEEAADCLCRAPLDLLARVDRRKA